MVVLCQGTGVPTPRPGFPAPDKLPILSIFAARPRIRRQLLIPVRRAPRRGAALASGAGLP